MESDSITNACMDSEAANKVRNIVNRVLRIDPNDFQISQDTNLFELGLESLNVIELITELELASHITIDVEDLSEDLFSRFGRLVEFMQRKVSAHA